MVAIERARLAEMFEGMISSLLKQFHSDALPPDPVPFLRAMLEPAFKLAAENAEVAQALRMALYKFLKFQAPGYDGYRPDVAPLLAPLAPEQAKRITVRGHIQQAILELTEDDESTLEYRKQEAHGTLRGPAMRELMSDEQADEYICALCEMLGLE